MPHGDVEKDMKAAKDALDHASKNVPNREDQLSFDLARAVALLSVAGAIGHLEDALGKKKKNG